MCDDFDYVKRLAKAASAVSEFGGGCSIDRRVYGESYYTISIKTPFYDLGGFNGAIIMFEDAEFLFCPDLGENEPPLAVTLKNETSDKKKFFDMVARTAFAYSEDKFKGFDKSVFDGLSAMEALEKLEAIVAEK